MKRDEVKKYTSKKLDKNLEIVKLDEEFLPPAIALKYYPLVVT